MPCNEALKLNHFYVRKKYVGARDYSRIIRIDNEKCACSVQGFLKEK